MGSMFYLTLGDMKTGVSLDALNHNNRKINQIIFSRKVSERIRLPFYILYPPFWFFCYTILQTG